MVRTYDTKNTIERIKRKSNTDQMNTRPLITFKKQVIILLHRSSQQTPSLFQFIYTLESRYVKEPLRVRFGPGTIKRALILSLKLWLLGSEGVLQEDISSQQPSSLQGKLFIDTQPNFDSLIFRFLGTNKNDFRLSTEYCRFVLLH